MAERIEQFTTQTGRSKYPWKEWQDGSIWRVREGHDFLVTSKAFRGMVYTRANTNGMTATTTEVSAGVVEFQFKPKASA